MSEHLARLARAAGRTLATAESLTGGRISSVLGASPDSSQWFRGAVVAYSSDVKHQLLGVPPGPVVSETSARAMAGRTAELLGADTVVAVTGAGGPDPQDGQDPGTVWFALYDRGTVHTEKLVFTGEPDDVVAQTVDHALALLTGCME